MVEEIIIRISAINDATEKINQVTQSISNLQNSFKGIDLGKKINTKNFSEITENVKILTPTFENLNEAIQSAGISSKQFGIWQKDNFYTIDNGIGLTNSLTGETISYGQAIKDATIKSRRFKFEWLSIMFAGMALERTFGNIVQKQLDLWGINQELTDMWTLTMVPVMEQIVTPAIQKIIDKIMK